MTSIITLSQGSSGSSHKTEPVAKQHNYRSHKGEEGRGGSRREEEEVCKEGERQGGRK